MKELQDGIYLHYGSKKIAPICPICGKFLVYHRPPRDCYLAIGEKPPSIRLTFEEPHAYLVQDPDGDWWLFPRHMVLDDAELDLYGVRHVPHPPSAIRAYLTTAWDLWAEVVDFAVRLEEILCEMEGE